MPVTGEDFVAAAKTLLNSSTEIDHRNAASRAYYGVYHHAQTASDHCPDTSHYGAGSHARLIYGFKDIEKTSPIKARGMGIAYALEQLRALREKADYEIQDKMTRDEAEMQIITAEKTFERINEFIQSAKALAA